MRDRLTFYRSYWEAVKRLRKASDKLSALEAIIAYALDGEERERTDAADALFVLVKPLLDAANKKADGGKFSANASEAAQKSGERYAEDTDKMRTSKRQDGGNNINNNKYKEKDKKNKCSISKQPPSLEEVKAYAEERNSTVDPAAFWEYFNAGDWKDSKGEPVRNWKQKFLTWEKYDKGGKEKANSPKSFSDIWRELPDE